jgi:quercetin dioxygenase-like cupin family protein
MTSFRSIALALMIGSLPAAAAAQLDSPNRKELKRVDLAGAPGMEVVNSTTEYMPGDEIKLHIHHGVESGFVVQGSMVQVAGKDPMPLPTGAAIMNLRDVPHGGFKVVGDKPLILFTVHIVDKGKPLYDAPK